MKHPPFSQLLRWDLLLIALSIGLALYLYFTPSIYAGHGESFCLLFAIGIFLYLVFLFFEKHPQWLIKGENSGDPTLQRKTLRYWKLLKLLYLLSFNYLVLVVCYPGLRMLWPVIAGLFLVYTIAFLVQSLRIHR